MAAREALGTVGDVEKTYIIEFIGSCRKELSRKIFSHHSLQLVKRQRDHIQSWADGRQVTLEELTGHRVEKPAYELISIVNSGPPENRIDVVFMGDGYIQDEREKFIDDITRLSTEMFEGETFRPWLPLINVWAVFAPSNESGIGTGGTPKDTPFGLYRDGTELRGIYTSKPEVAQSICEELGSALCDFPSLIANDDFYGGLGGEYIISTRSIKSGTVVLRHEMGHTFNDVGEEYDGGEVYEGVNSAASIHDIPWRHWISGKVHEEQNNLVFQKYPWYDLSQKGPYVVKFNTSGKFPRWYLQISTSGMAEKGSFRATLDGVELPWNPPGILDRTFSTWFNDTHGLSRGSHQLQFEVKKDLPQGRIIHQLCNIELMEYSRERKFDWKDPAHVSAYPTYNYQGQVSYRPTNEYCLMRNMTSAHFCPVCKEGLWLKFLERVSLLDEVDIRLVRFVGLSRCFRPYPCP
ncbi:hypothetical protein DSO57_1021857 [Entomophthora muscae]|uniref:Uncharacterized protein n=1 Tax=Entomophthora muscae TaxID=34485 RepID=A0ACC2S589_9FUNG|nr:hypothetical protein DSO57_1021857 [Entomophthora muscae]